MEIDYTLTEDDLRAYLRRVIWRSLPARRQVGILGLLLLVGVGMATASDGPMRLLGWIIAGAMAYTLFVVFRSDRRQLGVLIRNRDTRLLLGKQKMALRPEELVWLGPFTRAAYDWQAVETIDEWPGYAALMLSGIRGLVVPKRVFASEGEYVRFIETAKRFQREADERRAADARVADAHVAVMK